MSESKINYITQISSQIIAKKIYLLLANFFSKKLALQTNHFDDKMGSELKSISKNNSRIVRKQIKHTEIEKEILWINLCLKENKMFVFFSFFKILRQILR